MIDKINYLSEKWQLSNVITLPFHIFSTENKLILAYSEFYQKDVVIKICSKLAIDREGRSLQYFQGDACVKLLDFDEKASALLLRHVKPGVSLKDLFDDDIKAQKLSYKQELASSTTKDSI